MQWLGFPVLWASFSSWLQLPWCWRSRVHAGDSCTVPQEVGADRETSSGRWDFWPKMRYWSHIYRSVLKLLFLCWKMSVFQWEIYPPEFLTRTYVYQSSNSKTSSPALPFLWQSTNSFIPFPIIGSSFFLCGSGDQRKHVYFLSPSNSNLILYINLKFQTHWGDM